MSGLNRVSLAAIWMVPRSVAGSFKVAWRLSGRPCTGMRRKIKHAMGS